MFYHPDVGGDPLEVSLPGCEASCPLERWARLTESVTPDMETWRRECQEGQRLDQSEARTVSTDQSDVMFLLVGLLCLALLIIPVTFTALRCRSHRDYSSI